MVAMIVSIVAIIFTPFMLWHLFQAKWYKAIVTFCAIVILPFLIHQIIDIDNSTISFLLKVLPFLTFYFFYLYVELSDRRAFKQVKNNKKMEENIAKFMAL